MPPRCGHTKRRHGNQEAFAPALCRERRGEFWVANTQVNFCARDPTPRCRCNTRRGRPDRAGRFPAQRLPAQGDTRTGRRLRWRCRPGRQYRRLPLLFLPRPAPGGNPAGLRRRHHLDARQPARVPRPGGGHPRRDRQPGQAQLPAGRPSNTSTTACSGAATPSANSSGNRYWVSAWTTCGG